MGLGGSYKPELLPTVYCCINDRQLSILTAALCIATLLHRTVIVLGFQIRWLTFGLLSEGLCICSPTSEGAHAEESSQVYCDAHQGVHTALER